MRLLRRRQAPPRVHGFTLIELMVAIAIMALMALMSWRGLDGMTRVLSQTREQGDELYALQAGLSQWGADLDAITAVDGIAALEWDGAMMRMTRRNSSDASAGLWVVAWARKDTQAGPQWMRWQSPPVRTRADMEAAWAQAQTWGRNADTSQNHRQVNVTRLEQWQIFYFRNDAWSNPLSSGDASTSDALQSGLAVPEGVRLVLTLPTGGALAGVITRDWVRPDVGGGKS